MNHVAIIDDDPNILALTDVFLRPEEVTLHHAGTAREGLDLLEEQRCSVVLLDLGLPDRSGIEVLNIIKERYPSLAVIVLTARDDLEVVVECMRLGAIDFVRKPIDENRLRTAVRNALTQGMLHEKVGSLTRELRRKQGFGSLLTNSKAMAASLKLLRRAAESEVNVLLTGQSGTGKEVAARAIHAESDRSGFPFVAINCGAIPETLLESELFGHEKGAFTGATASRKGCFEEAHRGVLLLDEIGMMKPEMQVGLLRVLQEKCVRRVGGNRDIPVDVRVIAATNSDLKGDERNGRFREDLFYRLAVFPIELPSLCDRPGDVTFLARRFLERFSARHRRGLSSLTAQAERALVAHSWPGNVRELENVIERAVILEDGDALGLQSLPDEVICALDGVGPIVSTSTPSAADGEIIPFELEEQRILQNALRRTDWNPRLAAEALGIARATVYRKIEKYALRV